MKTLISLFVLFFSFNLWAQHRELIIKSDTKVYKSRSGKEILTTLEAGSRVPISTKNYGSWVKIKSEINGKWYYGWIPKKAIRGFKTRAVDKEAITGKTASYHRKNAVGVFASFAYASIADQDFNNAQNKKIAIQNAKGSSVFFGFHYDYSLSLTKQLHMYLALREHDVSGKALYDNNTNEIDVDMTQSFLAVGASLKNYKAAQENFWWSYGLEIAKTTDMRVQVINTENKIPDKEYGFFIFPHIGFGYDYRISGDLYLVPEAKLNLAINTGGLSYAVDLKAALSYAF